jgi:hypothetical protein
MIKITAHGDFGDDSVQRQITKLLQWYEQVLIPFTIRGTSRKAERIADVGAKSVPFVFNEAILCENTEFSEIWNFNSPVDGLLKRQRPHQFGILNADFLARNVDE